MKILYLGNEINNTSGGADVINKRNQLLLKETCKNVEFIPLENNGILTKMYFGISTRFLNILKDRLKKGDITHVFIPQSLLGRAARFISKEFPDINIITFYHNIEIDYAKAYLKNNGLKAIPFYILTKIWEYNAAIYSDYIITLNKRDDIRLKCNYGKSANIYLPTTMSDSYYEVKNNTSQFPTDIDYLFVGVAFYANLHGIEWFIKNVFPHTNGNLYIVGKGMDTALSHIDDKRIHIYGFVNDLSSFYIAANKIISPIFIGAGMKTKTAEAMMWGKYIIGTNEAFEGYDLDDRFMKLCTTPQDFIDALAVENDSFISESRAHYLKNYQTSVLIEKFKQLIHSTTFNDKTDN